MKFTITIPNEAIDDFCVKHGYPQYDAEGKLNTETKNQYIERLIKETIKADIVDYRRQKAAEQAAQTASDLAESQVTIT